MVELSYGESIGLQSADGQAPGPRLVMKQCRVGLILIADSTCPRQQNQLPSFCHVGRVPLAFRLFFPTMLCQPTLVSLPQSSLHSRIPIVSLATIQEPVSEQRGGGEKDIAGRLEREKKYSRERASTEDIRRSAAPLRLIGAAAHPRRELLKPLPFATPRRCARSSRWHQSQNEDKEPPTPLEASH